MTKNAEGYMTDIKDKDLQLFVEADQTNQWSIKIYNTLTKQTVDNTPPSENSLDCAQREARARAEYLLDESLGEIELDWVRTDSSPH